ncbi:CGNR zinc finger domain-containing protein [Paraburkholderia rhizosphaerae]|uniref:Putative RNA-binding Zn ribbon-like protein n=1 Tax=Paraburkholderia rhizosphaerae TaxID=480658 RepID=A0A4R8LUJ9_9BURK|nr:ABATE domain-containing protein [Paraburkholderia rhizosphaerae]TDY51449.1 putative RNA-binding Zn ribbon-like protein [Paraburkholderia rhizosphaerae]
MLALSQAFLQIADDPALDFLNTVARTDGTLYEYLEADNDVISWLQAMEFLDAKEQPSFRKGALVNAARSLRDTIRKLIIQKKDGKRVDVAALNAFLGHARYHVNLVRRAHGELDVVHDYERASPEQLLAPVAQAAAELLATGDFELVRKCESEDCILWFYDRTKAHRRRWCSMAMCGNRHKVANFRARQKYAASE